MTRNSLYVGFFLAFAALGSARAQAPTVVQAAPGAQTMYAISAVNIRAEPSPYAAVIGKLQAGGAVPVTGPVPGAPHWLQLTTGGFVSAKFLRFAPVVVTSPPPVVVAPQVVAPPPVYVEPAPVYVAPYYYGYRHPRYVYPY